MTPVDLLNTLAAWQPGDDSSPNVAIAVAQYQETVFRTIDVVIRRGGQPAKFDVVTARAVNSLPYTLVGSVDMCNAQIRATVAVLRTAVRIVTTINGTSTTKDALRPLFHALDDVSSWRNPGIAEGCFQALPTLLTDPAHDDLSRSGIDALFTHLQWRADAADLARLHVHLASASCFRRMLVTVAVLQSEMTWPTDAARLEKHITQLFQWPSCATVFAAFRNLMPNLPTGRRETTSDVLIVGTAFDAKALQSVRATMKRWSGLALDERMLLVRALALQLKAATGDWRDIERFPLLRRHYKRLSAIACSASEREELLWTVLAELPAEAAESMDAEVQAFVEHAHRRCAARQSRATRGDGLPGYVLAMVSPAAGDRIADIIVREIDLRLRHARSRNAAFDFGSLLYGIVLRNPHEGLFDQLLPRLSDESDRQETLLFQSVIHAVHSVAITNTYDIQPLLALAHDFFHHAENTHSPTIESLSRLLDLFKRLVSEDEGVWAAIGEGETGGLGALFAAFDELASRVSDESEQRRALAPSCRDRLVDLQSEVEFYQRLPVDEFEGRAHTVERACDIAAELIAIIRDDEQLYMPERVFLTTVVHHLQIFFERTKRWYCEEPQRQWKAAAHDAFWSLFAADPRERRFNTSHSEFQRECRQVENKAGPEPSPYPGQRRRFEKFFVRWVSSEIDAQVLAFALQSRWPTWFRWVFTAMTSFWSIALLMILPCMVAVTMHMSGRHELEGGGFFVEYVGIPIAAVVALGSTGLRLSRRLRAKGSGSDSLPAQYRFRSMFPRVAGFIAAPMALIVEFEHAYQFPLEASDGSLLLLMLLAFVAIQFTVTNAVAEDEDGKASPTGTKRRVRSIVAVALAQSFVIALLLSLIFAGHVEVPAPGPASVAHGSPHHRLPLFLSVLPREVELDIPSIAKSAGFIVEPEVEHLLHFVFYPTIILTWTALGVLFGVVFEGFLKGAKVRGERALAQEA